MEDANPFGFTIYPHISIFRTWYEVVDLSTNEAIFEIYKEGAFKPTFIMQDTTGKEVFTAKKISGWSGIYRIFKNSVRYATLDYSSSCCSSQTEIQTEMKRYLGSRLKGSSFEFVDNYGRLAFFFQRFVKFLRTECLVEVYDNIEPEIAILASVILDTIIRGAQSAAVASTAAVM